MRILFRLWIVAATLWVAPLALIYRDGAANVPFAIAFTAGPPLFLLALGAALGWAFRRY